MKFYESGKFGKAASTFNEFVYSFPYHKEIAKATFLLAESYFKDGQFDLAAMEYRRVTQRFEDSEFAERAELMIAESNFSAAPRSDLEQDKTKTALEYFKDFLVYHPSSELTPQAEEGIRRCRERLAKKEFDITNNYFKLKQYSSVVLYSNLIEEEFGGTSWVPKARLLKAKALLQIEDGLEDPIPILKELAVLEDETGTEAAKLLKKLEN